MNSQFVNKKQTSTLLNPFFRLSQGQVLEITNIDEFIYILILDFWKTFRNEILNNNYLFKKCNE